MIRVTGDTIALTPPLIVSEREIGEIFDKVARVISRGVAALLRRDGVGWAKARIAMLPHRRQRGRRAHAILHSPSKDAWARFALPTLPESAPARANAGCGRRIAQPTVRTWSPRRNGSVNGGCTWASPAMPRSATGMTAGSPSVHTTTAPLLRRSPRSIQGARRGSPSISTRGCSRA